MKGPGRLARARLWATTTRDLLLDRFELLQRIWSEFLRVEVIDRSMVIGAQALLALVPMLIVLAAFLPTSITDLITVRVGEVTGIDAAEARILAMGGPSAVDVVNVRTQTGIIGVIVAVLSATSFARAVQRAYTTVWELPRIGGVRGWGRCLLWLLCWLGSLEILTTIRRLSGGWTMFDVLPILLQVTVATGIWWVSIRLLLFARVSWQAAFPAALINGAAMVAYTMGSTLVMPRYAVVTAEQYGVLGIVLTVATWLVGFAFVIVMSALLGRAIAEDELPGVLLERFRSWREERRRTRAPAS